jgi:putative glutamine amidotransferase
MQVANVFFGGTLVPDIQWFGRSDHKKVEEGKDRRHPVWLVENTLLEKISGAKKGEVNSAHHQCVERLGDGLTINAVSPDGIVEGAEWKDKEGLAFLLLVQWHPERMADQDNPLAHNIRDSFLQHIRGSA